MTALLDWLRGKAAEDGVELDDEELAALGLADGVDRPAPDGDVLSVELPGEASGAVELFLSRDSIGLDKPVEDKDGLMWEPIIREGQWAVRPGGRTGKRRKPLKVVAGRSKDQRREIGLQDVLDAFDDDAIEYVTVPTSHQNHVLENTGFIKGLKIVDGSVKPKRKDNGSEPQKVKVLMGGYDIKLPQVKERIELGTIASRSAGLLYDYVNTETGKTYPVALEHVALTNKPWITGMTSFGRKVKAKAGSALSVIGLSLADEIDEDQDLLAQDDALEGIELSIGEREDLSWAKDESPNWLRGQINRVLSEARSDKIRKQRQGKDGKSSLYVEFDYPPNYRCVEAKPGMALISDGYEYGDNEANYWSAPFEVKNGEVKLADFEKWEALKKDYVPDERPAPDKDKLPLAQEQTSSREENLSRLQLAQRARHARGRGEDTSAGAPAASDTSNNTKQPPRGGEHMAGENGATALQLSEEAQRAIEAAEARAAAAEAKVERLSEQTARALASVARSEADARVAKLKADGFTEDKGFGGVLAVARDLYLADDGEPAVQSESFSDEANTTGELSLSDAVDRIFGAFKRGEDGKVLLGEQLTEPTEKTGEAGTEGEGKEGESKEGEAGATGQQLSDGKPGPGGTEEADEDLSDEANIAKLQKESPLIAEALGLDAVPVGAGAEKGADA